MTCGASYISIVHCYSDFVIFLACMQLIFNGLAYFQVVQPSTSDTDPVRKYLDIHSVVLTLVLPILQHAFCSDPLLKKNISLLSQ